MESFIKKSDEFVYRVVQSGEAFVITAVSPGNTMLDMILENDLCGAAQRGAHSSELDQHIGAVLPVLYHPSDMFQMPDRPGKTVQHRFRLGMDMGVVMVV